MIKEGNIEQDKVRVITDIVNLYKRYFNNLFEKVIIRT